MIKCKGLTKLFDKKIAVNNVNLSIGKGIIYGFLGTNGAGKTTTIKMLTGQLSISSGSAEILGFDVTRNPVEVKRNIGIVPDEPKIYPYFIGNEFIQFILDLFKMNNKQTRKDFRELCEAFDIDFLDVPISDMSHGMRQKIMVTSVLMRKPKVIFLDEPTVGLDARSSRIIKDLLKKRANEGATIFLTTHVLEIAQKMCDWIGILDKGVLITEGTIEELREKKNMDDSTSLEDLFLALTDQAEDVQNIVNAL